MNTTNPASNTTVTRPNRLWRIFRRLLIGTVILITLIACFYTIENWRGQRAWEKQKNALRARGQWVEWASFIPEPVPAEQNFFKAPKMEEWFVRRAVSDPRPAPVDPFGKVTRPTETVLIADVQIVDGKADSASQPVEKVYRLDNAADKEELAVRLRETVGPCAVGSQRPVLLSKLLKEIKPLTLTFNAEGTVDAKRLGAWLPLLLPTNATAPYDTKNDLSVVAAGTNHFRINLGYALYAGDYLEATEPLLSDFDLVRKALERPYSRIDCDYSQPFLISFPNFVTLRTAAQTLCQRAQCFLLFGKPEKALHELQLVHDLERITIPRPEGKAITLVSAMINCAIKGVYASVIEDGIRLHAWQEPQLVTLQKQFKETDLLSPLSQALREEQAAASYTFETIRAAELTKLFKTAFSHNEAKAMALVPRGWFYQNMVNGTDIEADLLQSVDVSRKVVMPERANAFSARLEKLNGHLNPYNFLLAITLPNFTKALQNGAYNQNLMAEAELACALERHRLAHAEYPETLNALVPQFLAQVPHDVIGGESLRYQRTGVDSYKIYSVGWNQTADNGTLAKTREQGDWVWTVTR